MNMAEKRLTKELIKININKIPGIETGPLDSKNLLEWRAIIMGPPDTPYQNGIFSLEILFNKTYPMVPPKVKFTSPIFHPNIYRDGTICLDILRSKWSPVLTIQTVLLSIQSLLGDPNIASPANGHASRLYKHNRKKFNKKVINMVNKEISLRIN